MRYSFETNCGNCTLMDTETGIVIKWKAGDFDNTSKATYDASTFAALIPEGMEPALYMARLMREAGDYICENYREFI